MFALKCIGIIVSRQSWHWLLKWFIMYIKPRIILIKPDYSIFQKVRHISQTIEHLFKHGKWGNSKYLQSSQTKPRFPPCQFLRFPMSDITLYWRSFQQTMAWLNPNYRQCRQWLLIKKTAKFSEQAKETKEVLALGVIWLHSSQKD